MTYCGPKRHIAAGLTLLACIVAGQAHATSVGDAVLDATLQDGSLFSTVLSSLASALTGGRGADADAQAENGPLDSQAATTSFFGDTGLLTALSTDSDGNSATASARNVLRGKVCTASVSGAGQAVCILSWNGVAKWVAAAGTITTADPLPDPGDVVSATLTFTYSIDDTQVGAGAGGSGSFGLDVTWDGATTFSGGAEFDEGIDSGAVSLTGDLNAFAGEFSNANFSINASDLDVNQEVILGVDYAAFFNSGEITKPFTGSMTASAVGAAGNGDNEVPEPGTLALFVTGVLGLVFVRWLRRKYA